MNPEFVGPNEYVIWGQAGVLFKKRDAKLEIN